MTDRSRLALRVLVWLLALPFVVACGGDEGDPRDTNDVADSGGGDATGSDVGADTGTDTPMRDDTSTDDTGGGNGAFRPEGCGDGVVSGEETCDPPESCPTSCVTSRACTDVRLVGNPEWCTAECIEIPIVECVDGDGCCPAHCTTDEDDDCPGLCGNDEIDLGETCDPPESCPTECDDGQACTASELAGAAATCTAECLHPVISACTDGDGCCPPGCTPENDDDCTATCGDGVRDPGERCDGDCPQRCETFQACTIGVLTGGAATCDAHCVAVDVTECVDDDGCCPMHCDASNDSDCVDECVGGSDDLAVNVDSVRVTGDLEGVWDDLPLLWDGDLSGAESARDGADRSEPRREDVELVLRNRGTGDIVPLGRHGDTSFEAPVAVGMYDLVARRVGGDQGVVLQAEIDVSAAMALPVGDLRLDSNKVRIEITVDGEPGPLSLYDRGDLFLRPVPFGPTIRVGSTGDGTTHVVVPAGAYDVIYMSKSAGQTTPANPYVVIDEARSVSPAVTLALDVPTINLHGAFTIGGEPPPLTIYDNGDVFLRRQGTSHVFQIGRTRLQEYTATIVPGVYDVVYRSERFLERTPTNPEVVIHKGVSLGASGEFNIDIPVAHPTATLTIDGAAPPASIYHTARIYLRPRSMEGDEVLFMDSRHPTRAYPVVPGRYDIVYRLESGGLNLPMNSEAVVREDVLVNDGHIALDIATALLHGSVTWNGASFPASIYSKAWLDLVDTDSGTRTVFADVRHGSFNIRVIPGTYDVHYRAIESPLVIPMNADARLRQAVAISGETELNIDVRSSRYSGAMLLDGVPFPASAYTWAWFDIRDTTTGARQRLARSNFQAFSAELIHGTYDVFYTHETGAEIPPNQNARVVDPFALNADRHLDIDVITQELGGTFVFNGLPLAGGNNASYAAVDRETGARFQLGESADRAFSTRVIEGSYELRYSWRSGDEIPRNEDARLGCVDVIRPR